MTASGSAEAPLPRLREDLRLIDPHRGDAGRLVYDPLRHRYLRIDHDTFLLLSLWNAHTSAASLAEAFSQSYARSIDERRIGELAEFLLRAELADGGAAHDWRKKWQQRESSKRGWLAQAIHGYLYFRVPLVAPDRFLRATLPFLAPLMSRRAAYAVAMLGLAGLYLVSRRWESFLATYQDVFTPAGIVTMLAAVALVKSLHELGHAYVAVRHGCRVPTLGIAFMVLMPLLYTDVTDAWRLPDKRQRLAIDAAGVAVELVLAAIALFLWPFLPPGPAQSAAFMVATASLVMSVGFNLNPFMRFDGYYILADATGMDNLQPRAFALARWRLRELLFGLGETPPEVFDRRRRMWLIAYAWATWIYRLVVFTGIAVLVYAMAFKVLGIVLFLVEILYFILLPIWREVRTWRRGATSATRQAAVTLAGLTLLVAVLLVPWSRDVEVPAILEARDAVLVHPPRPARVKSVLVGVGDPLREGDPLVELDAPDVDNEMRLTETRIALAERRLARRIADATDREQSLVLEDELAALRVNLAGLHSIRERLVVRAPVAGRVLELNDALHPGRWVAMTEAIARVGDPSAVVVRGYVAEQDLWRLADAARGRLVPYETPAASIPLTLTSVARSGAPAIELAELAQVHGGRIAASEDRDRRLVPISAQFLATMTPVDALPPVNSVTRGLVLIEGKAESLAGRAARQVARVLVRESGF
jgi:putative peptide zinc metalloprotease protein